MHTKVAIILLAIGVLGFVWSKYRTRIISALGMDKYDNPLAPRPRPMTHCLNCNKDVFIDSQCCDNPMQITNAHQENLEY